MFFNFFISHMSEFRQKALSDFAILQERQKQLTWIYEQRLKKWKEIIFNLCKKSSFYSKWHFREFVFSWKSLSLREALIDTIVKEHVRYQYKKQVKQEMLN